jgi:glycosyltransferase involved in cell wall biosynthesis
MPLLESAREGVGPAAPARPAAFPKALIVDLSRRYGGADSRALALLARFPPGEAALAGLEGSDVVAEARRLGLPVRVVGRGKADPRIAWRLARLVRGEGFEVLDSQNVQSKLHASLAAAWTGTALVSTLNSWYASEHGGRSIKGRLYTALELATNGHLSLYIAVSERDRQALLRSGLRAEDVELVYNAVDVAPAPRAADGDSLRGRLGLPADAVVCTAVGRLVPVKGLEVLVEAAREACRRVDRLVCVIVGEGEGRRELARRIGGAGLDGRVVLAGALPHDSVLSALRSSDLFAMPSLYEGTPIALLEAAALGRPIVASRTGGIPELVTDGEHALLVSPGSPAELAAAIVRLCEDRTLADRLGQQAARHARARFHLDQQVLATRSAHRRAWLNNRERFGSGGRSVAGTTRAGPGSRKPRLCFAIWSFGVGGAERMLIGLLKAIPRDRYDVTVVTLKSKGVYAGEVEQLGIPVHCLGKAHALDPAALLRLVRFLRRARPDLLNTHLWTADLWARLAGLVCGVPRIVVTEQNVDLWKSRARRLADRALFAFTDAVICVGDEVRDFYVREIGVPAEKTVVIPNAIDVSRLAVVPGNVRAQLGISAGEFVFACAARLHRQKAHAVLLGAVRQLRDEGAPPFCVLLVGDGPERAPLEELAVRLGVRPEVLFIGARTDVPQVLAESDAFVLSSDYEGTSLAILEAMAAGLPVVATDVGSNRSVVEEGEAGLIVPKRDPAALAAAMARLLGDREAAREMGRRGRAVVRARYGIEQAARATLELFDRLLLEPARGGPPPSH